MILAFPSKRAVCGLKMPDKIYRCSPLSNAFSISNEHSGAGLKRTKSSVSLVFSIPHLPLTKEQDLSILPLKKYLPHFVS